ncbi:flagellar hook-length control protein FliK [Terrilactibacillus laevilacticus]|uniref:Flagellar hook-length control protein FliK n=1 Tax=Terrilactibacillus laevilacticus TaxID=1380157 RepID=A0ABW5PPU7_9BACI|nr:flagellar hook-length control protein FliK [Terrilactibacillus laevilacticus]
MLQTKTIAQKISVKSSILTNKKSSTKLKMGPQVTFRSWMKMKKGSNLIGNPENLKKDKTLDDTIVPSSVDHIAPSELKKSSFIEETVHKDVDNLDLNYRQHSPSDHLISEEMGPKQTISVSQNADQVFQDEFVKSEKRPHLFKEDNALSPSKHEKHLTRSKKEKVVTSLLHTNSRVIPVMEQGQYERLDGKQNLIDDSKYDTLRHAIVTHIFNQEPMQTGRKFNSQNEMTVASNKDSTDKKLNHRLDQNREGHAYENNSHVKDVGKPKWPLRNTTMRDEINQVKHPNEGSYGELYHGTNREMVESNSPNPLLKGFKKDIDGLSIENRLNNTKKTHALKQTANSNQSMSINNPNLLRKDRLSDFTNKLVSVDNKQVNRSSILKGKTIPEEHSIVNRTEVDVQSKNMSHLLKSGRVNEDRGSKKIDTPSSQINVPERDKNNVNFSLWNKKTYEKSAYLHSEDNKNIQSLLSENRIIKKINESPSLQNSVQAIHHHDETNKHQFNVKDQITEKHNANINSVLRKNRLSKTRPIRETLKEQSEQTFLKDNPNKTLNQKHRQPLKASHLLQTNQTAISYEDRKEINNQNNAILGSNLLNKKADVKKEQNIQAHSDSPIPIVTGRKQNKVEDAKKTYSYEKSSQKDVRYTEFHSETMDKKESQNAVQDRNHDYSSNLKHGVTRSQLSRLEQEKVMRITHQDDSLSHGKPLFQPIHGQMSKIEQLSIYENNQSAATNSVPAQISEKIVAWLENSHMDLNRINTQELTIKLNPSNLGNIHIVLNQDENGLSANIFSESDDTQKLLQSGIHELKDILMSKDIVVRELHVHKHEPNESKPNNQGNFNQNFSEERNQEQHKRRHKKSELSQIKTWPLDFHDFLVKEV